MIWKNFCDRPDLAALNKLTGLHSKMREELPRPNSNLSQNTTGRADDVLDCWIMKALSANCRSLAPSRLSALSHTFSWNRSVGIKQAPEAPLVGLDAVAT